MARNRTDSNTRSVALEVCRSTLRLAVVNQPSSDSAAAVHTHSVVWRKEAGTLRSQLGQQELTAAFRSIASRDKLGGAAVRLTLNGDFCVTRVLSGTNENVRKEMHELEERSQLYLRLGTGQKVMAASVRQIDARHQHALLSVTSQKTIDTLIECAGTAGLQLELVEPSLVSLCRIVGRFGYDQSEPVMIVNVDEQGVELGISYQGLLLLDYRPGGRSVHQDVANIVSQHLARLQRYCFRYFRFAEGKLQRIYLCGAPEHVARVHEEFRQHAELQVEPLDLAQLAPSFDLGNETLTSDFAAAIGTSLLPRADLDQAGPNLMESFQQHEQKPSLGGLARLCWPLAAVLLVALGMLVATEAVRWQVRDLEAQMALVEPVQAKARELRLNLTSVETKQKYLEQISGQVVDPPWHEFLTRLGEAMPHDLWMDTLKIDADGRVDLTGLSRREEGVFEFVQRLERLEQLRDVALVGTRSGNAPGGAAVHFQLECKLANLDDSARREGK